MLHYLSLCFILFVPSKSDDVAPNRTAVLLTGQLRSGNLSWSSAAVKRDFAAKMFGIDDPPTPIDTIFTYFLEPWAIYSKLDLFVYVQLGQRKEVNDGQAGQDMLGLSHAPPVFAPVYDTEICDIYRQH